jgi:ribose 1,5-bisphosphokinase PhnN
LIGGTGRAANGKNPPAVAQEAAIVAPASRRRWNGENAIAAIQFQQRRHSESRLLAHWEAKGGSYFVTFRLADSLRQSAIDTFEFVRRDITRTAQWP